MTRFLSTPIGRATMLAVAGAAIATTTSAQAPRAILRGPAAISSIDREVEAVRGSSRLTYAEASALVSRTVEADRLILAGQLQEATRILREVIRAQREAQSYPRAAMQRLAHAQYALDDVPQAARTLLTLADEARAVSDPVTEFDALVDASVLYQALGDPTYQAAIGTRIKQLLNSPAIPAETRERVTRTLPQL